MPASFHPVPACVYYAFLVVAVVLGRIQISVCDGYCSTFRMPGTQRVRRRNVNGVLPRERRPSEFYETRRFRVGLVPVMPHSNPHIVGNKRVVEEEPWRGGLAPMRTISNANEILAGAGPFLTRPSSLKFYQQKT